MTNKISENSNRVKKITCRAMGGACDHEITGETADEMIQKSQQHGMEAVNNGDQAHMEAMEKMKNMSPEDQGKFGEDFKNKFDSLSDA
ncbi:MAG: DUF1059 domain-containing protein [Parcubacteria group bacterium]|jgi:TRAP-type C4-dicarboxylate transport system substrate-binding protein|nr:DUF1059 domain-containing protein [Parcubacteria group bacterium]|tara:strand:+ start:194 stop:457 length:264 start_codon:yes stop_codon:yes gene_type:complete